jgi:23S rRNA pseudouridine1911/1915/1917 synthase
MSTDQGAQQFQVPAEAATARLDRWLAAAYPEQSRTTIQRWIKAGLVTVNGTAARANQRLDAGATVWVAAPAAPTPAAAGAEAIALVILFEDADILVVDKPTGLVVHPAPGHPSGTLVNALLHHIPDLGGIGGELRPGIVHRLDKDTSGVMVVAKHERALRLLQSQFKSREISKEYLALTEGQIRTNAGVIDAPIGRDPRNRKRMATFDAVEPAGRVRAALTEFTVLARYTVPLHTDQGRGSFTFVRAHPVTGRTHQIRVHFAAQGHPLVGDPIYGLRPQRLAVPRLFLHATNLRLKVPRTGEFQTFHAPLPQELTDLLARLDQMQPD